MIIRNRVIETVKGRSCYRRANHFSIFIYKFRLAAGGDIIGGVRCHHWQRPLPIMSPPAANLKSAPFFPLRCLPLPVWRAPLLLNPPHRLRFASFKKQDKTK